MKLTEYGAQRMLLYPTVNVEILDENTIPLYDRLLVFFSLSPLSILRNFFHFSQFNTLL
jgi:hypothetical protein